jgi:hypothetical protein
MLYASVIDFKQRDHFSEAKNFLGCQEIAHVLWNLTYHYVVHDRPMGRSFPNPDKSNPHSYHISISMLIYLAIYN